jgi:NPCBM/NEW2 domain-containing protein
MSYFHRPIGWSLAPSAPGVFHRRSTMVRSCLESVLIHVACSLCLPATAGEKFPEPGPAEQKEAEKEVHRLFPPPGKDPTEVGRHAKKLLEAGKDFSYKPVQGFILLKEAKDFAVGVGDFGTALAAARAIGERYRIDLQSMEVDVLSTVARSPAAGASAGLVQAYLEVLDDVWRNLDFENARRFSPLLQALARKTDSPWLRGTLESRLEKLRSFEQWKKSTKDSKGKLLVDSRDPSANERLGKILCLVAGNWEEGLPRLVLCDHQKLVDAAKVEMTKPQSQNIQCELGVAWRDLSQGEKEASLARAMQLRAARWYDAALPSLTGAERAIVMEQLGRMPERFLCDMEEFDLAVHVGTQLGKRGELGHRTPQGETRVVVDGLPADHGLGMHAIARGEARARYPLNRTFKRLRTWVALNDSALSPESSLTFMVKGDGKVLWRSKPVQKKGHSQLCEASVEGVVTLELLVECPGSNGYDHSVWLDPLVSR